MALEEARALHITHHRTVNRRVAVTSVFGIALIIVVMAGGKQMIAGGTPAIILGVVSILLIVAIVIGGIAIARAERTRKAAIRPFTEGYERVAAVFKKPHD